MADDPVKISANLPKATYDQLQWIASERGTTMTEVLRRALEHESFLLDVTKNGGKVLTEDKTGAINRIIFK